jgi:hypothetical protein
MFRRDVLFRETRSMTTFRYYLLSADDKITCADFVEANDLVEAIDHSTAAAQKLAMNGVCGVEIWQDNRRMHRAAWPLAFAQFEKSDLAG